MADESKVSEPTRNDGGGVVVGAVMAAIFALMVVEAVQLQPAARFAPLIVGVPALIMALVQLTAEIRRFAATSREGTGPLSRVPPAEQGREMGVAFVLMGWFAALVALTVLSGVLIAFPAIIFGFLWQNQKDTLGLAVGVAAGFTAVIYGVFDQIMGLILWPGVVPSVFW